jgi:hypothetical protein
VTSRQLLALFDSIYVTALATWLGSTAFFSFGITPVVSKVVRREGESRFTRAIFSRFYLWGAISGAIALPAFVAGPLCVHEYRGAMVGVQALAIVLGILVMLYGGNSLAPAINSAADRAASNPEPLERLIRRAAGLNVLVMAVVFLLLVGLATRHAPRTSGIIEMTPEERMRYDAAISRVIQDVEAKYGMGPARQSQPGAAMSTDPQIDQQTVEEIESYYAQRRKRGAEGANGKPSAVPHGRHATEPEHPPRGPRS